MCTKDELINKLNERSLTPSQVFSLFEINYKPLIETPSPVNRLNGRKFGQNYGTSLVSLVRQCNTELQKKSKENSETVVNLMEMSLKLISKIHSHLFDDNNEYYQL